jgi:nicotinate-nucleotide adenylyltransferase
MRIAFFGGTFDPPHCGHLRIAQAAADRLHLDKVLFAPVGHQPLKQEGTSAGFEDRAAMVELAIAPFSQFEVSLLDAPRPDGRPNYTIATLLRLRQSLAAEDALFCLMGADSFLTLRHWYRAAEILFVCNFIVAGRPGSKLDAIDEALPFGVRVNGAPQVSPGLVQFDLNHSAQEHSVLYLLPDLHEDISATEIRAVLSGGGQQATQVLPDAVATYIREHRLYRK